MATKEWTGGPPCKRCGKGMPPPEKIGEWMEGLIDRVHRETPIGGIGGTEQAEVIWMEGSLHVFLQSWSQTLKGLCSDCSYADAEKKGEVDEWFHEQAFARWEKRARNRSSAMMAGAKLIPGTIDAEWEAKRQARKATEPTK